MLDKESSVRKARLLPPRTQPMPTKRDCERQKVVTFWCAFGAVFPSARIASVWILHAAFNGLTGGQLFSQIGCENMAEHEHSPP